MLYTTNTKHAEMVQEAINDTIETLKWYSGYYCDLHNEVFNTNYYIIGTYKAKEALKEFDVFEALEKVQEYEKFNFGEVTTDLSDAEKLVNMLYYIIGEEVLAELETLREAWDEVADDETNEKIIAELKEMLD